MKKYPLIMINRKGTEKRKITRGKTRNLCITRIQIDQREASKPIV